MNIDQILSIIPPEVITAALAEFGKAETIRSEGREAADQDRRVREMLPKLRADEAGARAKYDRDIAKAASAKIFGGTHEVPDSNAMAIARASVEQAEEMIRKFENSGWTYEQRASECDRAARNLLGESLLRELALRLDATDRLLRIVNALRQSNISTEVVHFHLDGVQHKFLSPHASDKRDVARQVVSELENSIRTSGSQNTTETHAAKRAA
jgi:hypothetical protein